MANVFGGNPIVIDTVITAGDFASSTGSGMDKIFIQAMNWDASGDGALALVVNRDSSTAAVWSMVSTSYETSVDIRFPKSLEVSNISIPTIGGGTLYIYLK